MAQTTITGIITCRSETLPEQEGIDLLRWMQKGEFATLTKLAEGKVRQHMADAVKTAIESTDHPLLLVQANASLQKAQRYATFLEVLHEIKEHKTPYQTVKWT